MTSGASQGGSGGAASGGIQMTGGDTNDSGIPGPAIACPTDMPSSGDPCTVSIQCSWGDSPYQSCRTVGTCQSGSWSVADPPDYCMNLSPQCPSTAPAEYDACSDTTLSCLYPDQTLCSCHACDCNVPGCFYPCGVIDSSGATMPTGTTLWYCQGPPTLGADCPTLIPNNGTTCDAAESTACPGGSCRAFNATCTEGLWIWSYAPFTSCPVCASPETPIATPQGDRAIADLREGDLVYSVVGESIAAVPITRATKTPVNHHQVMRVITVDGRVLAISAGHPTANGRTFAELQTGQWLDGQRIASVESVAYGYAYTFDILPASDTGTYFAAGMLIGSTLH